MKKIIPCLWFNGNGQEVIDFYTSVFKNSSITEKVAHGKSSSGKDGELLSAIISLNGEEIMLISSQNNFSFSHVISLFIPCETQAEIDYYWDALKADGGREEMCGWLVDKFGVSWQVIPSVLMKLLSSDDNEKAERVSAAMLQMQKLDIDALKNA